MPSEAVPIEHAVAYHEAAHAVVAAVMGHDVYAVWVNSDGVSGEMWHRFPASWLETRSGRLRDLVVTVAGTVAEAIVYGIDEHGRLRELLDLLANISCEDELDIELEGDGLAAARTVWDLSEDEREKDLREAHRWAREILLSDWADVESIARCIGP